MQLRDIASVYLTDAGLMAVLLQTRPVSRAEEMAKTRALLKTFPCVPAVFRHYFPRGEMVEAGVDLVSLATADAQPPLLKPATCSETAHPPKATSTAHLVCKPDFHPTVYAWLDFLQRSGAVHTVVRRRWTGQRREIDTYHYAESIPLRDGDDTLRMN